MQPHGDNHPGDRPGASATVRVLPGTSYEFELRDERWVMSAAGPEIESITGYPPSDFIDHARRSYGSIVHPEDYDGMVSVFRDAIQRRAPYAIEYRVIHADGSTRWVQGHGRGAFDADGNVTRIEGLFFDVTERRMSEERLAHLALHDPLTDLPNRALFQEHLTVAIANARRSGDPVVVALLDLDHFKRFNDRYGHQAGDRLLKEAAAAWRAQLRADDLLARYGGEEFGVCVTGRTSAAVAEVLGRVQASTPLGQTFSAGVATWTGEEAPERLVARADEALYQAKHAGRSRVMVHDGQTIAAPPPLPAPLPGITATAG